MKKDFDLITFLFWVGIVFFLDPGGFVASGAASEVDATRSILFKFGILGFSYACFFIKFQKNEYRFINDKFLQWYGIVILIWAIYYFLWYYGLNNPSKVSPIKMILRNQRMVNQILLVFPITYFASINLQDFTKILTWTTIIIMVL
jgi:hypothetical protein